MLAGIFFYLLLVRGLRAPPLAAFAGAVFYMMSPQYISLAYSGHEGKVMVAAWLPFVVWRMKAIMDKPGLLNLTLMAAGISMCLLTSHVQLTYFMLWGLFTYYVVWLAVRLLKRGSDGPRGGVVAQSWMFWGAVALGIGMAFVNFYPSFQFVRDAHSVRGIDRGFDFASSWSMHWPEFFSLWVPEFGGWLGNYWSENAFKLNTEYAGAVLCPLAVLAVVMRRSPWRIMWASIAVFAVLYAMGRHTPVFHAAYALVPGVKKFRACSMMMFWFTFSMSVLAALFLADVIRGRLGELSDVARARWRKGLLIAGVSVSALAIFFSVNGYRDRFARATVSPEVLLMQVGEQVTRGQVMEHNITRNFVPALWMWWLAMAAVIGMTWALIAGAVKPVGLVLVVLAMGIVDALRVNMGGDDAFVKVENPRRYLQADPELAKLASTMRQQPFRCFTLPGTLSQNGEGVQRLESLSGFHDNELRWYRAFRGDQSDRNYYTGLIGQGADGSPYLAMDQARSGNAFLNLANARYLLGRQGSRVVTIENEGALARLSFAPRHVVMDTAAIVEALRSGGYDYRTTVALVEEPEGVPDSPPPDSLSAPALVPRWLKYTPNVRSAEIEVPSEGWLRISEVFYPGWRVLVDNRPAKVYQADCAWMAVRVSAGKHRVDMAPRSMYLSKAALVSLPLIGLVLMFWMALGVSKIAALAMDRLWAKAGP